MVMLPDSKNVIKRPNFSKKTIKSGIHFHEWKVDTSLSFDKFKRGAGLRVVCTICGTEKVV